MDLPGLSQARSRQGLLCRPYRISPGEEDFRFVVPTFAAFLGMLTDYDPEHIRAIKRGDVAGLRRWLNAGGDPSQLYHSTPLLEHAVFARQPDAAAELLSRGATIYDRTRDYVRGAGDREFIALLTQ